MYDILIIGGGPAGLTAAIYGLRAGKSVLVIEKGGFGGQIAFSPKVENIPGFAAISGAEFADKLTEQALGLGADVEMEKVISLEKTAEGFVEDVRFNRPARDGEQYDEEGVYTITVRTRYTGQDPVKTIYVGTDEALRAHAATGLPMEEITRQLSAGAVVNEDGTLTSAEEQTEIPEELLIWIGAGAAVAALVGVVVLLLLRRRRRSLLDYDGRRWWG